MSAYLDKSQGITFVYSNIYDLYKKAKNSKLETPFVAERSSGRVIKAEEFAKHEAARVDTFQPKELEVKAGERSFAVPMGVKEAEEKALKQKLSSVQSLQKNLSNLTEAHAKLRFLLQELETITKKN